MNFNAQQFSQLYPLINVNHTYVEGFTVAFQITTASQNQRCNINGQNVLHDKRKKGIREIKVKKLMCEKLGFLLENFGLNILGFTLNK